MNTYINTSPFPIILDLKSGRVVLTPGKPFETNEEIFAPNVELQNRRLSDLEVKRVDSVAEWEKNKVVEAPPIFNIHLNKRFK